MAFRPKHLLREVHRRSLWQVLGVYVVAAWFVLQVVDTLTSVLQLPEWFPPMALVLLLVGLPIVLSTAFVQSGFAARGGHLRVHPQDWESGDSSGAEGLDSSRAEGLDSSRAEDLDSSDPESRDSCDPALAGDHPPSRRGDLLRLLTWRNAIGGGVLAFALWGVVAAAWVVFGAQGGSALATRDGPPSIAVLPFINRSVDESDAFFTDGLHDELLTQLSKIAGIRVISRTSVMSYRDPEVGIPRIAGELGVDYVLEGALQRAGNQVRLNVQLIEGATDTHVWADIYDRAMTVDNLLAIQTEIVTAVAREIQGVISPEESDFLADRLTENSEAYEMYLRGEDWLNRGGLTAQEFTNAVRFHEEAATLDPTFAVAHAKAASAHAHMYFQGHDVTPERLDRAQVAMDRALELDRMHPQVREAYGDFLYYGQREYGAALIEYQAALEKLPSSVALIARVAWIQRRQGLWEESLDGLVRVRDMDPRSGGALMNLAVSLGAMRRYQDAADTYSLAVTFNPDMAILWSLSVSNELERGDTAAAVANLNEIPDAVLRDPFVASARVELLRLRRDYSGLLNRVNASEGALISTSGALRLLPLYRGYAYQGLGDTGRAREAFEEARVLAQTILTESPDDHRVPGPLGLALAELGLRDEAVAAGRRGAEMLTVADDALWGPGTSYALALIHARLGEAEPAVNLLENVVSVPSQAGHIGLIELEPLFDPIRSDPRFQALIERYSN